MSARVFNESQFESELPVRERELYQAVSGVVQESVKGMNCPFQVTTKFCFDQERVSLYKRFDVGGVPRTYAMLNFSNWIITVWVLRTPLEEGVYNRLTLCVLDNGFIHCQFGEIDTKGSLEALLPVIQSFFV